MSKVWKVLTVKEPWGTMIMRGCVTPWEGEYKFKDVENRTWAAGYRGEMLIHTSKTVEKKTVKWLEAEGFELYSSCPGHILGKVYLDDIVRDSESPFAVRGQYHWLVSDPVQLVNPVPCKGKLGLWTYEGDLEFVVDRSALT